MAEKLIEGIVLVICPSPRLDYVNPTTVILAPIFKGIVGVIDCFYFDPSLGDQHNLLKAGCGRITRKDPSNRCILWELVKLTNKSFGSNDRCCLPL